MYILENKKYKEIIHLDTDTMNSILAQLDAGIINSFSIEENEQQTDTLGTTEDTSTQARARGKIEASSGALPLGSVSFEGALTGKNGAGQNRSTAILEGQKDILNKAFHDYSLELLLQDLRENDLLKEEEDLKAGEICLIQGSFKFYDFELLTSTTDFEGIRKLMLHEIEDIPLNLNKAQQILAKTNPTAKEREQLEDAQKVVDAHEAAQPIVQMLSQLNIISRLAGNLLNELALIKVENYIGLVEKSKLRESSEALSFRTDLTREAKFLFQMIGEKKSVFGDYGTTMFSEADLDKVPNMILDIVLGSFQIIKRGDTLIKPIAIFYE